MVDFKALELNGVNQSRLNTHFLFFVISHHVLSKQLLQGLLPLHLFGHWLFLHSTCVLIILKNRVLISKYFTLCVRELIRHFFVFLGHFSFTLVRFFVPTGYLGVLEDTFVYFLDFYLLVTVMEVLPLLPAD